MADLSASKSREPLSEATHRINASYAPVDHQNYKPRYNTDHESNAYGYGPGVASQPDIRVTAPLASNPPTSAVMKPAPDSIEAKRLSQASYDSTSSSRSKKNYKTHIGPWQLGRTLGKGSSARVRLCRHNVTNQLAAVKIVNRRMAYLVQDSSLAALSKWDSSLPDQINGEMRVPMAIEREVAILKLIEHPHIMKLYDIWENRSEIYLILEYIDQGDLFTFINSRGRLTEEVSVYFFRQMISAITYCHSFNICHRDLKPENILISADLQIKIADFGMAALHQTDTHQLATACGSPHYAAPELLKNKQYKGDKADIWSLGVILYAMLAAYLPFDDPDLRVMMSKTKKGQYEMPKHLSPEAEDLIHRMLQVNPERRISLREIWRHPLVQKYSYLDNYGANNGQPPDIRKGFQYTPVARQDIDPQLLRQLRSMWHMFSEHDLALKLTCDEPNDQKAFYWLLFNYRNQQLEDFKPELAHSMSDYHHLKPGAWKKRVATRKFSQPRAGGHGRSVSRFTVISNAAEDDEEAGQSYDPYRGSRMMLQPCSSQISHAKITVHRDQPTNSTSHAARMRGNSTAQRARASSRASTTGRPPSRGSMTSLHSIRQARKPSLRHKRAVDFSHVRKRSGSAGPTRTGGNTISASQLAVDPAAQELASRSLSPEPLVQANGTYPKAKGAPVLKDTSSLFNEELRHFSSNIARDCDEAFRSPLIVDDSIVGSTVDSDRRHRDSPFTFSLGGTPVTTPATDVLSDKTWGSRPLPPVPSEMTLFSPSATNQTHGQAPLGYDTDDENAVEQVAHLAIPVIFPKQGDRRVVSAPVQGQGGKKSPVGMPSINEDKAINVVSSGDKVRIVSAPPHTPPKKGSGKTEGMDYLTRVENTIRVVDSPSGAKNATNPRPSTLRKKQPRGHDDNCGVLSDRDEGSQKASESQGAGKVKKWFKRPSKANTDSSASTGSQDQVTLVGSEPGPDAEASQGSTSPKKKAFNFPFWKSNKSSDLKLSIGDGPGELTHNPSIDSKRLGSNKSRVWRDSGAGEGSRNIEVKQNWLARLFRVKPETSYLCMTISRRRARREVTTLLRQWRRYGIKDVQVDKERNIVFAKVGAKNYLNLKEVSFAAEIMTVIEHGRKQPLSIVRFTQERGAASSFNRVVDTMRMVLDSRHLLVVDRNKEKMMIKTLNSGA